jgi:hypothetical protein
VKAFVDADGDSHSVGEEWVFLMSMFDRMHDVLTLCVKSTSEDEWQIPLTWDPDAQQAIIQAFSDHVTPVQPPTPTTN